MELGITLQFDSVCQGPVCMTTAHHTNSDRTFQLANNVFIFIFILFTNVLEDHF